jgi:glycerol kinase
MGVGLWKQEDLATRWTTDRVFEPQMSADQRESLHTGWLDAVRSVTGSVPSYLEEVAR